ncbi:hypothetical protein MUN81_06115 [Hymenobacter sp. 5317J-9]|uniref:hypothetical protein n=1 Tax=Hymenobacter sp. 5317J-9 TaxID=2932250 RepID=UPI001FD6DB23|nr:hypothetical protein [Hymenobacter sp. 5317J-9]UOQ99064.1 hypothetical protein MUN81_06115 [Hymenobacter sp. 5317J-9]
MLFQERQSFVRHWVLLLFVPVVVITVLLLTVPPKSGFPLTWPGLIGPVVGVAGVALLLTLRLDTRIDKAGAHYRLFPLQWQWRTQSWPNVARAYVRSYDPLSEYGGWGLKGTSRNRAYNMAGHQGLQLELTDGRRLLLGTQRPAEVAQVLQELGVPLAA